MHGRLILETDGTTIAGKVASHTIDEGAPLSEQVSLSRNLSTASISASAFDNHLTETCISLLQTITQALAAAREHFTRSLLR